MEQLLIIIVCLVINALLAAFEMAFVSVSRVELKIIEKNGPPAARWLLKTRENPERVLSVIQTGITLVGALAATVGGVGAAESIQPYLIDALGMGDFAAQVVSVLLIVLPLSFISVVLGEITPKTLALRSPMTIALKGARWIAIADRIFSPVVSSLEWATKWVLRTFFPRSKPKPKSSQDDQNKIEIASENPSHREAILNFAFIEKRKIKNFIVPWEETVSVIESDTLQNVVSVVFASGHTRLPVLDKNHQVRGILHTKEFLAYRENGGKDWQNLIRPALKVSEADTALAILRLMQKSHSHMAIVYSTSGERVGIVALEDILEEFLGEIYDEDEDSWIRKIFTNRIRSKLPPDV